MEMSERMGSDVRIVDYDNQPLELLGLLLDVDVEDDFFFGAELLVQVFCSYCPCPVL